MARPVNFELFATKPTILAVPEIASEDTRIAIFRALVYATFAERVTKIATNFFQMPADPISLLQFSRPALSSTGKTVKTTSIKFANVSEALRGKTLLDDATSKLIDRVVKDYNDASQGAASADAFNKILANAKDALEATVIRIDPLEDLVANLRDGALAATTVAEIDDLLFVSRNALKNLFPEAAKEGGLVDFAVDSLKSELNPELFVTLGQDEKTVRLGGAIANLRRRMQNQIVPLKRLGDTDIAPADVVEQAQETASTADAFNGEFYALLPLLALAEVGYFSAYNAVLVDIERSKLAIDVNNTFGQAFSNGFGTLVNKMRAKHPLEELPLGNQAVFGSPRGGTVTDYIIAGLSGKFNELAKASVGKLVKSKSDVNAIFREIWSDVMTNAAGGITGSLWAVYAIALATVISPVVQVKGQNVQEDVTTRRPIGIKESDTSRKARLQKAVEEAKKEEEARRKARQPKGGK